MYLDDVMGSVSEEKRRGRLRERDIDKPLSIGPELWKYLS